MFDWQQFLDSYHIRYVTKGANVARGHISVHCPMCGAEDPSEHMTINLAGKGWRCYRNDNHRGVRPARLVAQLLNIPIPQAMIIVGQSVFIPEDFMGAVMSKLRPAAVEAISEVPWPKEFKPLNDDLHSSRIFIRYMLGRGYSIAQINRMHRYHGLCFATQGPQRGRIIFPVEYSGKLQSWTGRTVYPDVELRYKTLSTDPENAEYPATGPISDFLLWHDDLLDGGDCLVLVEGPFDALKVRTLGRGERIFSTCCFTASPSDAQIELLHDVAPLFKRRVLLLDRNTLGKTLKVASELASLRFEARSLPSRFKDPGELEHTDDLLDALS